MIQLLIASGKPGNEARYGRVKGGGVLILSCMAVVGGGYQTMGNVFELHIYTAQYCDAWRRTTLAQYDASSDYQYETVEKMGCLLGAHY